MRSRIASSPGRVTVADAAAEWLATLSDSACTDEERQQFATWLRRSNLHVEEFLRLSVLARKLGEPAVWADASARQLIAAAKASSAPVAHLPNSPGSASNAAPNAGQSRRTRWMLPAAAAAGALVAIALFAFDRGYLDGQGTTYATAVGEQRSITLQDGSLVELNTQSRLRARFTAAARTVELLQGEAVFKVAKNPQRPFRVLSGPSEIVAVGTAFNVYARNSGTVVTVLEGRVRVSRADAGSPARGTVRQVHEYAIELARGEQAVIAPKRPIVRNVLADPDKATAWTERRLIFEDTPLAAVTAEFARYYTAKTIRIADPSLAQLHITGVFDASDPASLVAFLKTFGAIDIREDERGWVLVGTHAAGSAIVQGP